MKYFWEYGNGVRSEYWMPFNGGIGLHDAPWRDPDDYNKDSSEIRLSHGCVNVETEEDAKDLFENTTTETMIIVYE